jgi:hypothetical protein
MRGGRRRGAGPWWRLRRKIVNLEGGRLVARRPQHGLRRDATATFCGVAALEDVGAEAVEDLDAAVLGVCPAGFPDGAAHVLGGAVGEGNTEGFLGWHTPWRSQRRDGWP